MHPARPDRPPTILATLLDAAGPGRARPAAREAAFLLRHGLGRRVAEFGRRAFAVAAAAAVLGGLSGVALGSWLAWRDVDPMAPGKVTAAARYETYAAAEVAGVRAGYLAVVQINAGDEVNPFTLGVDVMWAEPPGQTAATVAGGLAGALLAALLGLFTARRMRRYGPRAQRTYSRLCVTTLLLLAPACLGNIPTSTGSLLANTHRNGTGPSVYWGGFVFYGAEPLAILAVAPILAILVGCLWPRPATARTPTPA